MIKKELLLKVVYGLVISYLVALLTFVTFKNFLQLDASNLSALGSMLSAAATCFAALVAYWLYNDWRAPQYLQKISYESKEIFRTSRTFKVSAENLLEVLNTNDLSNVLNNDSISSRKYKSAIDKLLDNIDDLFSLLEIYKFNFDTKISFEEAHLFEINKATDTLKKLYECLANPHYSDEYQVSVCQVKDYSEKEFKIDISNITVNLIDTIFKFHVVLLKK